MIISTLGWDNEEDVKNHMSLHRYTFVACMEKVWVIFFGSYEGIKKL